MEPVRWKERLEWRMRFGYGICSVGCWLVRLAEGESILTVANQGWRKPKTGHVHRNLSILQKHTKYEDCGILVISLECSPSKGRYQRDGC